MRTLFQTTDELKNFVPVMGSLDFDSVLPFIARAEQKFIIPLLSKDQYTELLDYYHDEDYDASATDALNLLLEQVRRPLAQFTFYLYAAQGNVNVGSAGIMQTHTENSKPAFQWAVEEVKQSYLDGGFEGLNMLEDFLIENIEDYEEWATSAEYPLLYELFINRPKEFNIYFSINNNRRTFMAMRHILKRHNDIKVKNLLGADLWDEIKEQVIDRDISVENEALLAFIRPALVHLTVADAVTELSVKIDEFGITVVSPGSTASAINSRTPAASSMLNDLSRNERVTGEQFLQYLKDYLIDNADDYPLYSVPDEDDSVVNNDDDAPVFII